MLFADVLIVYLVRGILRLRRTWGSGKWERVNAKVDFSQIDRNYVRVAYTYQFGGQAYSATDTAPFLSPILAERRVERFKARENVIARVNPLRPQQSVLKPADQSYETVLTPAS